MNYKGILFFLGIYSLIVSFFSLLNIFYSIYFDSFLNFNSYLILLLISLLVGLFFYFVGYKDNKNISFGDQIVFISLGFVFIPLLISIPYFLSIYNFSFLNSYFESVSGFTATGFSTIEDINNIDEPLLLWRSTSQWLGGLFFLMTIIGTFGSKQIKIKPVHLVSGISLGGNFYNNFNYNFLRILLVYFVSTIFVIFLFNVNGIRLLDSLNIAFTSISSGGFMPSSNLSNIFQTNFQVFILAISLLFPIFNFYLLFNIFSNQFKFSKHQEDLHLGVIVILVTLLFFFFIIPEENFFNTFFNVVSSISTSGLATYNLNYDISLLFILLTIVGGSLISTSSGLKYIRFYILLKISYQEIYRLVKPINIFNKNLFNNESRITDDDAKVAFLVFITFITSLFIVASILTLDYLNFESSFKLSILTLTNTTASSLYGLESLSFYDLSVFSKVTLIIFMILGKIEIIAILFLINKFLLKE